MHIDVIPAQKPKPEERTVLAMVTQQANNALDIRFGDDNTSVNLALLKSIFKKYRSQMDNKDLNIKEIPQFDNKEIFRAIDIQNCTTLGSNNSMGEIVVCDDVKCALKDGMIGDWNVQTTINWFKKYSRDSYKDKKCKPGAPIIDGSCVGRCWGYVKRALQAGGFPFANSEAAYQAKSFLLENGFKCIRKGFVDGHNGSDYPDKCVGDITVFEACSGHKYGHIDMWSGSKWVSDFWQEGNWISGTAKTGFKVFRYTGVGKK